MFDLIIDFEDEKPRMIKENLTAKEMAQLILELSEAYILCFTMTSGEVTSAKVALWFGGIPREWMG